VISNSNVQFIVGLSNPAVSFQWQSNPSNIGWVKSI
jgi:hypothetical protein